MGGGADDFAKLVATVRKAADEKDVSRLVDALKEMKAQGFLKAVTVDMLTATKAGILLAGLKKHTDIRVTVLAKDFVDAWKDLVKSQGATAAASASSSSSSSGAGAGAGAGASSSAAGGAGTVGDVPPEPEGLSSRHPYDQLHWRLSSSCPLPTSAGGSDVQAVLGYPYEEGKAPYCHKDRVRELRKGDKGGTGPVLLWMSRDQRVADNWALLRAQEAALAKGGAPLVVTFNLVPSFHGAPVRAYGFMLRGLRQVERDLAALGIPFVLTLGDPTVQLPALAAALGASLVVTDFSPLRTSQGWKKGVAAALPAGCGLEEVDAHNIVPCWHASPKLEVGARTIRKKIHAGVGKYATPFPRLQAQAGGGAGMDRVKAVLAGLPVYGAAGAGAGAGASSSSSSSAPSGLAVGPRGPDGLLDWPSVLPSLSIDYSVPEVPWAAPGERAGRDALARFLPARLGKYDELRNNPCYPAAQSNLSPWLHYGQLSPHRVLLELRRVTGLTWVGLFPEERKTTAAGFAEELVVRRELSDNFCWYNPQYDSLEGAAGWAQGTLNDHAGDKRTAVYSYDQFDAGRTHEALWNAAQMELVSRGKLHGFMRMYWAKKILEWSASPAEALRIALALNDRYNLDGRDPNGYVGVMWALAGVHDMGWTERPVFGKIRYMNLEGCKRKFEVARYISMWPVKAIRPALPPPTAPGGAQAVAAYAAAAAAAAGKGSGAGAGASAAGGSSSSS